MAKRLTALLLSTVFSFTQILFAHRVEAGVWDDRRARAAPLRLASSAPAIALPPLSAVLPGSGPSLSRGLRDQTSRTAVETLLAKIDTRAATVRKISLPAAGTPVRAVVLHLQDVHRNTEAQTNLTRVLRPLLDGGLVDALALEGEFAREDFLPFRAFADRRIFSAAADYLSASGRISGPVRAYLDLPAASPITFNGVDDRAHYDANVRAYLDASRRKADVLASLATRLQAFDTARATAFTPALTSADAVISAYQAGTGSLADLVALFRRQGIPLGGEAEKFSEAAVLEKTLNWERVERERRAALEALIPVFSAADTERLMAASLAFRTGGITHAAFYGLLSDMGRDAGRPLSRYPALAAYVRYVTLSEAIDVERLFADVRAAEIAVYDRLATTESARALVDEGRRLRWTGQLVNFSLTRADWNGRPAGIDDPRLKPFEDFYSEALARDHAMAGNVSALMASPAPGAAIRRIALVTGGFHAEGLTAALTARGAAVITLTPRLTRVDAASGSAYLSVFAQEHTPLEKLFRGEKLFLSPEPKAGVAILPALLTGLTHVAGAVGDAPLRLYRSLSPQRPVLSVRVSRERGGPTVEIRETDALITAHAEIGVSKDGLIVVKDFTEEARRALITFPVFETALQWIALQLIGGVIGWTIAVPLLVAAHYRAPLWALITRGERPSFTTSGAAGLTARLGLAALFAALIVATPFGWAETLWLHVGWNAFSYWVLGGWGLMSTAPNAADPAADAIAAREGERLQRMINHFNGLENWRIILQGPLTFPEGLRPGRFSPPAGVDPVEAWWDQADLWWAPLVQRAHASMVAPDQAPNPSTARMQASLIGRPLTGETVLDVGVGFGTTLLAMSALGAATINAIDSDPASVALAERNVQLIANRTADFRVRQDDASRLATVADGSIDTATLFFTAGYVLPGLRARMSRRLYEALKPGGQLVMTEHPPRGTPVPDGDEMSWPEPAWRAVLEAAGFTVTITTFENNGLTYYRIVGDKPKTALPPTPAPTDPPAAPPASPIEGLTLEQARFVAAVAHAQRNRNDDGVPAEAVESSLEILFSDSPLPANMDEGAIDYLRLAGSSAFDRFLREIATRAAGVDRQKAMRFFDRRRSTSVLSRMEEAATREKVLSAAVNVIDAREERPLVPERLRATEISVYSATRGNVHASKGGIQKTRNEDFGLRYILPDGTIIMFTGDGMGGHGHGDQAAQLTAAAFYLELVRFWRSADGNDFALTDADNLAETFGRAVDAARALVNRDINNTQAGVVFEVLWAHPRANGSGWFMANFHAGDSRTEIGEPGRPLRPASIDNDTSGEMVPLERMDARIRANWRFRFLRSVNAAEDLASEELNDAFRRRAVVNGGLVEGYDEDGFFMTHGSLPNGAFVLAGTDGRLDPLTEAGTGRVVAESDTLADVAENLSGASQPTRDPDGRRIRTFREKTDDVLNQVAALGPLSSLARGPADEEAVLSEAADFAEQALAALVNGDRPAAEDAIKRAQISVSGIPERNRARVVATRSLVAQTAAIIRNTAVYFVAGEDLREDGISLGRVADGENLINGKMLLIKDESSQIDSPAERDPKIKLVLRDRDELAAGLGKRFARGRPGPGYYEERKSISATAGVIRELAAQGVDIKDGATLADIKGALVNLRFPNGSGHSTFQSTFFVLDNGVGPAAAIPGFAILYNLQSNRVSMMEHSPLLDQTAEAAEAFPPAMQTEAGEKMTRAMAAVTGMTPSARQTKLAELIDGNTWEQFGLSRAEIDAERARAAELSERALQAAAVGDEIVLGSETILVLDTAGSNASLEPGTLLVYRYESGRVGWLLNIDRLFFNGRSVVEIRRSPDETVRLAEAARAHLRDLLAQPGKNMSNDIDELPWDEVLPPTIPPPAPSAMVTRGTRWLARALFGWSGPGDETKIRALAVGTELVSSSIPVLHVLLHDNRGAEWVSRSLKHVLILAGTWLAPFLLFDGVSLSAVLVAVAGNMITHVAVSVLPWILYGRKNTGALDAAAETLARHRALAETASGEAGQREALERILANAAGRPLALGVQQALNAPAYWLAQAQTARYESAAKSASLTGALEEGRATRERAAIVHIHTVADLDDLRALAGSVRAGRTGGIAVIVHDPALSAEAAAAVDTLPDGTAAVIGLDELTPDAERGVYRYDDVIELAASRGLRAASDVLSKKTPVEIVIVSRRTVPFEASEALARMINMLINLGDGWARMDLTTTLQAARIAQQQA